MRRALLHALGQPFQRHRAVAQVGEQFVRDLRVQIQHIALGQAGLGKDDAVHVGEGHLAFSTRRHARGSPFLGAPHDSPCALWLLTSHLHRFLVHAKSLESRLPQQAVLRPFAERDLRHQGRLDPVHRRRLHLRLLAAVEGVLFLPELFQPPPEIQ